MTVMMIEHDMGVVMDISHRVMVLDFGRKIAEGDPAAVLARSPRQEAAPYLGEEDEGSGRSEWKPPAPAEDRGMMDYAGRVAAGRYLPEAVCASTPQEHGGENRAARKGFRGSGARSPGTTIRARVRDFALGLVELGLGRGDRHRHHRGQPGRTWVVGPKSPPIAIGAMVHSALYRDVLDEGRPPYLLSYGEARLVFRRGRGAGRQAADAGLSACPISSTSSIPIRAAMRKYDDPPPDGRPTSLPPLGRERAARRAGSLR